MPGPSGPDATDNAGITRIFNHTERHQSQRDAFLVRLDDATRSLMDPSQIIRIAAGMLSEYLGADRCSYGRYEPDPEMPNQGTIEMRSEYLRPDVPSLSGRYAITDFGPEYSQSMLGNFPQIINDVETEPFSDFSRTAFRRAGIRALICIPLHKAGRLVATLGVAQFRQPRTWLPDEVELVTAVANRCWESIERAHVLLELKASEQRLQEQWKTFDTVLSNTPDLTYTFDLEGRFTYANRRLILASQRALKDTVGKTPAELGYPPELANRIKQQIRQVIETAQPIRAETSFKLPTGEVREYEYIYAPVIGDDGQVKGIAGSSRDITERKQIEDQLRNSEAQFRQLIDSLPQLVWCSTPEGRDDLFNKQWLEYTGLSYEEVDGEGLKIIHPDDLPLALERWSHSLQTGEPYEIEYRCRRFDGQYRWFLGRARAVVDEQGRVVRWFGTCTDIHDKKESETALRKAHRELEEFSYVASHDLQEPLRMVNIYTQLMLKKLGSVEGDVSRYASFVQQGVKRMEGLLADLLAFSRVVHTAQPLLGYADLSASLAEAQSVLSRRIEETDAVVASTPLPVVRGDTEQLAHVFQNLLSNSLKYRSPDRRPEIKISATKQGAEFVISVQDNGIGFEPQYSQSIFGLFKRLHKDEYPGTGLGLAICQRMVERHGGRMWAEGRPDEGATFYFSLAAVD